MIAVPPPPPNDDVEGMDSSEAADEKRVQELFGENSVEDDEDIEEAVPQDEQGVERRECKTPWTYAQARLGEY
jgi:hypothetical protein